MEQSKRTKENHTRQIPAISSFVSREPGWVGVAGEQFDTWAVEPISGTSSTPARTAARDFKNEKNGRVAPKKERQSKKITAGGELKIAQAIQL